MSATWVILPFHLASKVEGIEVGAGPFRRGDLYVWNTGEAGTVRELGE